MALYKIDRLALSPRDEVTFSAARLSECGDLQRLLRDQVDVVAPDTLVIAEEFSDWDGSQRRIDLLAVDRDAILVVIELKITEDGGHMELQALRYAAMISSMTFDQAVETFSTYLRVRGREEPAREVLLRFLRAERPEEVKFGEDVRIVLVSPNFSKELTSTVLWLVDRGVNIECIRFRPYRLDGTLVADVQRIIPLPEADEYQVRVRAKAQQERAARAPTPTVEEMWRRIEAVATPAEASALRELYSRVEDLGATWFTNRASFIQSIDVDGRNYYFFTIRYDPKAVIEIEFKFLVDTPAFGSDARREELRQRLNRIPGFDIAAERIAGAPKIPAAALTTPSAMNAFIITLQWAASVCRSVGATNVDGNS